jgi:diguanylate cyclase (GGDEF)-like protein
VPPHATLVVTPRLERATSIVEVAGELVIGGPRSDLDLGLRETTDSEVVIAWRAGAWRLIPHGPDVRLDGELVRAEIELRHGQRIAVGERRELRFLIGHPEEVLDQLRQLRTLVDGLTDVFDRRFLLRYLGRLAPPTAVLMIDLDGMKRINDHYGFLAGDRTLQRTAARLRAQVTWPACVTRFGGEEFVAVLPGATHVEALQQAERLRAACAPAFEVLAEVPPIHATVSIGIAMLAGDALVALRAAEDAMVRAKQAGRDRVAS